MLFRPSTTFPAMEGHESDEEADDVLRLIWESSRQVLAKYFDLLRSRHLNYSWVCLYTIFMAGLANVYSIGCCAQRWKRGILAFLPSYLDVVSDIRDCSNILTAICEKWDDARGSCDIFNQLSMSALKELATASLQPITAGVQNIQPDNGACRRFSESIPIAKRPQAEGPVSAEEVRSTQAQHPISPGPEPITLPNIGQQPSTMYSEFDPIIDFQQLFQGLQDSVHANDVIDSNEVMQGFSQEWFGR
ncbi:fungal-specific transcription factor domain-containing protein [Penicillium angulare]|uniref:Fungal-specific transcription factor domain-containing protein n=1 Tax=Penicillium angulare TaxID=116970 RepID=A0A9W9JSN5_9EURO|nr:fungal-specific transcription factor domain-containing protein [Penicillium angulare]